MSVPASKKLWRISKEANGIYYEIKLDGVVIDRLKVDEPVLKILKERDGI